MEWLAGTVIGFVVVLALVVVLARESTGRWEREKRVAARPRVRLARPSRAQRGRGRPGAVVRPARVRRRVGHEPRRTSSRAADRRSR